MTKQLQAAIDNAKRTYDIDIPSEIKRIKNDMDIDNNKYPVFFSAIRKDFNKSRLNKKLNCPMNYLYGLKLNRFRSEDSTLPMSDFYIKHELKQGRSQLSLAKELNVSWQTMHTFIIRNNL